MRKSRKILLLCIAIISCLVWIFTPYIPKEIKEKYYNEIESDYCFIEAGESNPKPYNTAGFYLANEGDYDYSWIVSFSVSKNEEDVTENDVVSSRLIKSQNREIVEEYDLTRCTEDECSLRVTYATLLNDSLYFLAHTYENKSDNAIYKISKDFTGFEKLIDRSKYGQILQSTLTTQGSDLIYITSEGYVVRYDGIKETKINKIDFSVLDKEAFHRRNFSFLNCYDPSEKAENQINPLVCVNGDTVYFAIDRGIYCLKNDMKPKKCPFHIWFGCSSYSFIQNIEVCDFNKDLLKVTVVRIEDGLYYPGHKRIYIYNPKTGNTYCIKTDETALYSDSFIND